MLTLDSALKTAQDGLVRNPICRITSTTFIDAIPFDGQYFNTSKTAEQYPYMIEASSGRLAIVFSSGGNLVYRYSDTGKIQFSDKTILSGANAMYEAAIVEIESDRLGIILSDYSSGLNVRLRSMIISETGTILSAPVTISSYSYQDFQVREPTVVKKTTGGYLTIYRKTSIKSPASHGLFKRTSSDFLTWSSETDTGI